MTQAEHLGLCVAWRRMPTEEATTPCEFAPLLPETRTGRTSLSHRTKAEEAPSSFSVPSMQLWHGRSVFFPALIKTLERVSLLAHYNLQEIEIVRLLHPQLYGGKSFAFFREKKEFHLQKWELGHVGPSSRLCNSLSRAFSGKFKILNMIYKSLHDLSSLASVSFVTDDLMLVCLQFPESMQPCSL